MITANTLRDCIRSRTVSSERNHKLVSPVFSTCSMSALSTGTLTERLFEIPRLRWRLKGPPRWLIWLVILLVLTLVVLHEMRTSVLQSRLFSCWASHINYAVAPGPSPSIVFPQGGPFDLRLGYSLMPDFQRRLEGKGYSVAEQALIPCSRISLSTRRRPIRSPCRCRASCTRGLPYVSRLFVCAVRIRSTSRSSSVARALLGRDRHA